MTEQEVKDFILGQWDAFNTKRTADKGTINAKAISNSAKGSQLRGVPNKTATEFFDWWKAQ